MVAPARTSGLGVWNLFNSSKLESYLIQNFISQPKQDVARFYYSHLVVYEYNSLFWEL